MKHKSSQGRREMWETGARQSNRLSRQCMHDADTVWHVAFVLSGKEFLVQRMLDRKGVRSYLPLCQRWRRQNRYNRQKVKVSYPAMSGMLFVAAEQAQMSRFNGLMPHGQVYGVLGMCGRPVAFEGARLNQFITDNRFHFTAAQEERYMRTRHEFKVGDQVRIADGPFEGQIVDVQNISGPKAHILIELFGGTQNVEIDLDKLKKD